MKKSSIMKCIVSPLNRLLPGFVSVPIVTLILLINCSDAQAQVPQLTQTVKGTVIDTDSNLPLAFATVFIVGTDPVIGTSTNLEGEFKLESVPVGRVTVAVSYMGYHPLMVPNVVVNSGKETVLELKMSEYAEQLEEAVISAYQNGSEPINEMALVSARSISIEEMNRLAAGFNDPAVITASLAGVSNSGTGGNDIVIRGNSPKYIQWRLEGVPITNPNHFNSENAVNGSTSTLNTNVLSRSDFFTGAFPAEYGNALSGIYDVKMRNGNNEKFEAIAGIGLLGTDLTLEGPFSRNYKGSYLINYRYSTATVLNSAGLIDVEGDPIFQDASLKINLPTEKYGNFVVFGLAGKSEFAQDNVTMADDNTPGDESMSGIFYEDFDKSSHLINAGLSHFIQIGENGYLRSTASYSNDGVNDDIFRKQDSNSTESLLSYSSKLNKSNYQLSTAYNNKLNSKNSIQVGTVLGSVHHKYDQSRLSEDSTLISIMKFDESIRTIRNFISWKHKFNDELTLVAGMHNTNVLLNKRVTLEPRVSMRWRVASNGSLNIAYGMHSTMESVHHYFTEIEQGNSNQKAVNEDLDLLKAHHFVLGYDHQITPNLKAGAEAYFQYLYNLPVENDPNSYFATINEGTEILPYDLVNEGTGKNYGIELSLQRSFNNNYYFLLNTSIYESKYKAKDGIERNTRFNGNYVVNIIAGKEFTGLGKNKNQTLALNARLNFSGGMRIIPLLRDASGNVNVDVENNQYWDYTRAYNDKLEDLYSLTLSGSYKFERVKTTHEIFFNFQNITNNEAKLSEYYDPTAEDKRGFIKQFGLLPNVMYKIYL